MKEKYTWVPIFNKIAKKLLEYRNNRPLLLKIMYEILEELNLFDEKAERNCNFDSVNGVRCKYDDFDPFSFMNRIAIYKKENRKQFILKFEEKTNMKIDVPNDFDGVPSVNAQMSCMISFKDERKPNDIDDLWDFFEVAIKYPEDDSVEKEFIRLYDLILNKPLCGYNVTSCLFRLNGNFYISLDKICRDYLEKNRIVKINRYPTGNEYIDILNKIKNYISSSIDFESIPDFSYKIWKEDNIVSNNKDYCENLLSNFNDNNVNYYWLNANPKVWSFSEIKVGETIEYTSVNTSGNKRRIYQNYLDVKKNDKVIAYESTPVKEIVGICVIEEGLNDNVIKIKKVEQLINPIPFNTIKETASLSNMEYLKNSQGSLFKLDNNEYEDIIDIIRESNPIINNNYIIYTADDFLHDVYMTKEKYEDVVNVLQRKRNIILEGAPGVGKTYMAQKIAYSIMNEKNDSRIEFVQFHQNYSYEDFVEGYRPTNEGRFELTKGIFYNFCKKAENDYNHNYFMIIDEINRGNLSKIFGELLMLIENDKRNKSITLEYSKVKFSIPSNIYIIGLMNTADRSLAIIDYALRRRFSFIDINPAFDNNVFIDYVKEINNNYLFEIIDNIKDLNKDIVNDSTLGKGFEIGHSYFCQLNKNTTNEEIKSIIKYEILPTLREYWFDDESKINEWSKKLLGD